MIRETKHFLALTLRQSYVHGIRGFWIVVFSAVFSGQVILSEFAHHVKMLTPELSFIPPLATFMVVTKFGSLFACLLLVSFSGAAIAAETGMMKLSQQWDAFRVEGIPVWRFFVLPRIVACIVVSLCLSVFNIVAELATSIVSSPWMLGLSEIQYWDRAFLLTGPSDLLQGLIKAIVFGFSYGSIAIVCGLRASPTSASIGKRSTQAVVLATLVIIIEDFVLSFVFSLGT